MIQPMMLYPMIPGHTALVHANITPVAPVAIPQYQQPQLPDARSVHCGARQRLLVEAPNLVVKEVGNHEDDEDGEDEEDEEDEDGDSEDDDEEHADNDEEKEGEEDEEE